MKMRTFIRRVGLPKLAVVSSLLVASMVLGFNCSGFAPMDMGSDGNNANGLNPDNSIGVALLTAEQILKTMLSSTGTENAGAPTADDDLIMATYALRSGSLPSDQSLTQATAPMLISVANLASAVCAKTVNNDMAVSEATRDQRLFFREIDFTKGLSSQQSAAVVSAFDLLARNSWRRDTTTAEQSIAATLLNDFSTGANMTDPAQTKLLAVSLCTAVLSSIDALTY